MQRAKDKVRKDEVMEFLENLNRHNQQALIKLNKLH